MVIPTRNRVDHLTRLLVSIQLQHVKPLEILIIDSSDELSYQKALLARFPELPVTFLKSSPSVCIQRNIGIRAARCPWIFLCDDDIELPPDYIEKLKKYLVTNKSCGAVAGRLMQKEQDKWQYEYPVNKFGVLLFRYIFQLSIWGSIDRVRCLRILRFLQKRIEAFYKQRGNTFTNAGWPLITNWHGEIQTSVYSLGANIIKRDLLLKSPYDEVLDASGIGDNYGVALGFNDDSRIHVSLETEAYHHRAIENRLQQSTSYYRRLLALHYFISTYRKFNSSTARWFLWSLLGNALYFTARGKFSLVYATFKVIALITIGSNPYIRGKTEGRQVVAPSL